MRIELLRTHERSPDGKGKFFFEIINESDADTAQCENVFPREGAPSGWQLVHHWTGRFKFTLSLEPVGAPGEAPKVEAKGDAYDQMEDKDLMARMTECGLKYDHKRFNRFKGIQDLREADKKINVEPAVTVGAAR